MSLQRKTASFFAILAVLAAGMVPARAGGPLYVTGASADHPGQPYRWALNPVPYRTDRGGLGNLTNLNANQLVSSAFQVWQDVDTANISFQSSGQLDTDISGTNILNFQNAIQDCSDTSQPIASIIYDLDGSIISALGMDNNSVLGVAAIACTDDAAGAYQRSVSVLNGRFIDGSPDTPSHSSVTLGVYQATLIHEFGHLLGLDHSQINLNCLTDISCSPEDLSGVPVMFPVLLNGSSPTLRTDDKAALSAIYPDTRFSTTTGRIQGRVFFSDGRTPAQGYNVIGRLVGDSRRTAASCVSGFLYTAAAGNPLVPNGNDAISLYGSRDQTLIGFYDIAGLPSGDYTIEVEAINDSGGIPFVGGSSVGPIGNLNFQFKMPGACNPQYLNYPSSSSDNCSARTTVSVGAGITVNTNTDVILLGTPSRYDAWEDGP
jgi:hypothetical protein